MIATCANQDCGKTFDQVEGKFFRFRQNSAAMNRQTLILSGIFGFAAGAVKSTRLNKRRDLAWNRPEVVIRLVHRVHLSLEEVEG